MILTALEIQRERLENNIVIDPFRERSLGVNSYDVHLGSELAQYATNIDVLDSKRENELMFMPIDENGIVLMPGQLYLGVTEEYTETRNLVPFLDGKSGLARLGVQIHATAGKGDVGFCNHWTLEISVLRPVRIYAGMPIGQLMYFKIAGKVDLDYSNKPESKYTKVNSRPEGSKSFKYFYSNRLAN